VLEKILDKKMTQKKSSIIVVDKDVLNSKAFGSLRKGSSAIVYFDFLMKRIIKRAKVKRGKHRPIIVNNGELEYTYSEAKKKRGFSKPRFHAAIKELVEKGLIDITRPGGGYDGEKSLYGISDRWKKYGTSEFELVTMQRDTRQGRGFAAVHNRKKKKSTTKPNSKRRLVRRE
jgi:hypothetical protein